MASITDLPVKTLVKVLADLRGGEIGFDPYRDPRTSKKEALLGFILKSHSNDEIIAAIKRVHDDAESSDAQSTDVNIKTWLVEYEDMNRKRHSIYFASLYAADAFIGSNPQHRYLSKKDTSVAQAPSTAETIKEAMNAKFKEITKVKELPPPPTSSNDTPEAAQIAALLASMAQKGSVDSDKVKEICDARAQDYIDNILEAVNTRLNGFDSKIDGLQFPTTVQVLRAESAKPVDLGLQHKHFPMLLKMAQARTRDGSRLNVWLKGPAGSGKTTAAQKVSEALEMAFHFNGAISTEYELMGFKDAAGHYHRTAFREAFEHGGVYLFDEVDSSLPKAVLAFNAALANGRCRFPDAMIDRHKDCLILAGANTAGNGANSDYVGRMKQDLAFLNRFVMLDWPLDEALEKSLAANKDWVRKVQRYRSNAEKRKIKGHIISPRATFYGEALLAVGLEEEFVEQAVLRGALTDDQWAQLCQ